MRDVGVFNMKRALPRMSWSPKNLYNLYTRTVGDKSREISFRSASSTLFQRRWKAKAVVRAYHGDYINEKIFKRWYLPETLPDVRPRRQVFDDKSSLEEFARRKQKEKDLEKELEQKGMAPVGSLMFAEVERRIDVFIFRCCFAHSVYEARRLVIHGDVLLNGKKHQNANTRLAPGDMVSVNPSAIRFFKPPPNDQYDDVNDYDKKVAKAAKAAETAALKAAAASDEAATEAAEASTEARARLDEIEERKRALNLPRPADVEDESEHPLTPFYLPKYAAPWLFIPPYIEPSFPTCSAIYVRHPTARPGYSEIPTPYDADGDVVRYAWEWYAQRRPRVRSQSRMARRPEDRALALIEDTESFNPQLRREMKLLKAKRLA